jgi:single-strand DNA-binding protein
MGLNKIVLMGNLTRTPELRHTQQNVPVASFTLAVSRDFQKDQTDFIDIVAWRQTAEFVSKYFDKGSSCAVIGSLQNRKWTDKDGNNRVSSEVIAEHVYFTGSKQPKQDWVADAEAAEEITEDDLPF